jgi:hypothetical protein
MNKIDSVFGKYVYSKRMKIIEPVFANIRNTEHLAACCLVLRIPEGYNLGLNRFTLRGKAKVNVQWNLFNIVHNIGKILNFGILPYYSTA